MTGLQNIYVNKRLVAKIVRRSIKPVDGIYFFSSPEDPLQLAHHEHLHKYPTRIHENKVKKPIIHVSRQKYLYVVKGTAQVELSNTKGIIKNKIKLNAGDGIIIMDIMHKVVFSARSKAIEIKQGPYEE